MKEMQVWSLGQEDPLEKEMATHSCVLAWEIPQMEVPGGLQALALQKSLRNLAKKQHNWAAARWEFIRHSTCSQDLHSLGGNKSSDCRTVWLVL